MSYVSFPWVIGASVLTYCASAQPPTYMWAKMLPGNVESIQRGTAVDATGNVFVCGEFWGTVDFDPGPGVASLTPPVYGTSGYLAKYDGNGNYLWAKYIPQITWVNAIVLDAAGNPVITGMYSGTVDFDPGPGTAALSSTPSTALFAYIAKFDAAGNFTWVRNITSMGSPSSGNDLAIDASGNIFLTGRYSGTTDFDPGAGVVNLTSLGSTDDFMAKYDATGALLWVKAFGGTDLEDVNELAIGPTGDLYLTGSFRSSIDADPGLGVCNLVASGTLSDMFLAHYDANGNHLWSFRMGSTGNDIGTALRVDASGYATVAFTFSGTIDVDPGPGTMNLTSALGGASILARYSAAGALVWAKYLPLNAADIDIAIDPIGRIFLAGDYLTGSSPIDMDPGAGVANLAVVGGGFTPLYNHILAKYDASGNYLWAGVFGHSCYCNVSGYKASLFLVPGATLYYSGIFQAGYASGTVDFDPGPGVANLVAPTQVDNIFFAKYTDLYSTLPVELIDFSGENRDGIDHLRWSTATEHNNDRFEVERSGDGVTFETLGSVSGAGNSQTVHAYTFDDRKPLDGVNYYCLKQVDFDGQYAHSAVIALQNVRPATDCTISTIDPLGVFAFNCTVGQNATLEIHSADGRLLSAQRIQSGTNERIDLTPFRSGTYLVRVLDAGAARTYKLVRE